MPGIINKNDIISKDALKPFDDLNKKLKGTLDLMDKMIDKGKTISKSLISAKSGKELNKIAKESAENTRGLNSARKESIKLTKQIEVAEGKMLLTTTKNSKTLATLRINQAKVTRETKLGIIANQTAKGSYDAINISLNKNIARYKGLTEAERKNNAIGGQLIKTIGKQDMALKKLDTSIGRSQRHVGNYKMALGNLSQSGRSLAGAFGAVGGAFLFANIVKGSIKNNGYF